MSNVDSQVEKVPLGVTDILNEAFSMLFRNLPTLGLIILIPSVFETVVTALTYGLSPDPSSANASLNVGWNLDTTSLTTLAMTLLMIFLAGFGTAALTHAAFAARIGNSINIAASMHRALQHAPVVIVCLVLSSIPIAIGLMLLIVPGLLLMAMLMVLIPAIVIENAGFGAFSRSSDLTKGYRWPIVGLLALYFVAFLCISMGFSFVMAPLLLAGSAGQIAILALNTILNAFFYGIGGLLAVLTYERLHDLKEGSSASAEVFS